MILANESVCVLPSILCLSYILDLKLMTKPYFVGCEILDSFINKNIIFNFFLIGFNKHINIHSNWLYIQTNKICIIHPDDMYLIRNKHIIFIYLPTYNTI